MDIEKVLTDGIVFRGGKSPSGKGKEEKVKTKAKKKAYITGQHGSGAAKMKAAVPVHAIDIDPVAVRSARENARRNRVPDRIHTLCGDASLIQAGKYDLILANINRNIILEDLSTYARGMKPGALLITSGFYEEDCAMIEAEAVRQGLEPLDSDSLERWATVTFRKLPFNL